MEEFFKEVDIGDLHLKFKQLPLKISFKYGWSFLQKLSSCIKESLDGFEIDKIDDENLVKLGTSLIPNLGKAIDSLTHQFSHIEILEIIKVHTPYILVSRGENFEKLNIDFDFSGKPELLMVLLIKIIEVYYKNFFTESLNHLNIVEKVNKMMSKVTRNKKDQNQK